MAMIEVSGRRSGELVADFPDCTSPIHFERFFDTL